MNILNRIESGSVVYFENCVLVGRLASAIANGGKIEFGPGNTLIETSGMKIVGNGAIVFSADTSYATPSAYKLSKTVSHPNVTSKWEDDMILTYPAGAAVSGAVDTEAEAKLLTGAHFRKKVAPSTLMTTSGA